MRYRCKKGHEFIYPAKKITGLDDEGQPSSMFVILGPQVAGADNVIETRVCPFCRSLEFDEVKETDEPDVPYMVAYCTWEKDEAQINRLLGDGWVIQDKLSGTRSVVLFKYKTESKESAKQ